MTRATRILLALGAVGILVDAGRSGAAVHHGWANYDSSDTLDLTGAIREVEYENPHVLIRLETSRDSAQRWLAVLAPPARMQRRGLPADSLRVGMQARVVGYPHREVADEMRAERIIIGDKTTELR